MKTLKNLKFLPLFCSSSSSSFLLNCLCKCFLFLIAVLCYASTSAHASLKPFIYSLDEATFNTTFINPLLGAQSFYNDGFRGASSLIGNVEGGHIWPEHAAFTQTASPSDRIKIFTSNATGALNRFEFHATGVGSVLAGGAYASQGSRIEARGFTGMAPNATIFSGALATGENDDGSFEISPEVFVSVYSSFFKGANGIEKLDVINSSFGEGGYHDATDPESLFLDQLALQNPTVAFVVGAGNEGGVEEKVGRPASSFNNITVGSVGGPTFLNPSIFTTPGLADFYNPVTQETISGARHAVDLAAPGELLSVAAYFGNAEDKNLNGITDGTSLSSPIVAGGIALLKDMARTAPVINHVGNSDAFDTRVMKSVLMASATKTVGWNNGQNEMNITTQPLDLLTGAGRVNLDLARDVYFSGTRGLSGDGAGAIAEIGWDAANISLNQSLDYSFASAFSHQTELTVALNWFIHHDFEVDQVDLEAETIPTNKSSFSNLDLELWSLNDSGDFVERVGASMSTYDNTELLHFDSLNPGKYGFKVNFLNMVYDTTNDFNKEFYGLAWDSGYVGDANSLNGSLSINSKVTFTQNTNGVFNGTVSGNGKLIKEGDATLILDKNNTHTGGTFIKNGTLWAKSSGVFGTGPLGEATFFL
jgi:autotransporter-associated beta strand protein